MKAWGRLRQMKLYLPIYLSFWCTLFW